MPDVIDATLNWDANTVYTIAATGSLADLRPVVQSTISAPQQAPACG
jgi:hypothetical protein